MFQEFEFFITGATLGLLAGITPGPLLTLVITQTLKYNRKEGMKIALSPFFSDLPIVILSLLILDKMSNYENILAVISFLGSGFLIYMAYETIKIKPTNLNFEKPTINSVKKGILTNILSPHVYMFWILVGAPITLKAYKINILSSILFILGFYIFITSSKISIAIISEKTKNVFSNKIYITIINILGLVLIIFAIILIKDGLEFLELV
ncbi:MAG: LysE family transporter [Bacteroidales bacterium]|jgi:threonine/homoserine/homoserine lactone efflux protein|nr:LysE family transporter [Bacteroidales bacterium]